MFKSPCIEIKQLREKARTYCKYAINSVPGTLYHIRLYKVPGYLYVMVELPFIVVIRIIIKNTTRLSNHRDFSTRKVHARCGQRKACVEQFAKCSSSRFGGGQRRRPRRGHCSIKSSSTTLMEGCTLRSTTITLSGMLIAG